MSEDAAASCAQQFVQPPVTMVQPATGFQVQ
jgi:hypothetical protein